MIWRDDDKRDEQQRKLEYARELEQQIELRKALEREEKQQQEEWERRFVMPRDEASPAKWWTELRASEPRPVAARLGFQMDASALPYTNPDPAADQGFPSVTGVTPSRQRFHATLGDPLASHDRLREKAQQIEWKRLLDEQLREKERRQQQEAEEKRLREREEAEEEMRAQREQQLRAQRKLGIHNFTPTVAFTPENYVAIPSPPAPARPFGGLSVREEAYDDGYDVHPPPAPVHESVDFNFRQAMGLTDAPPQLPHETARGSVVDEYRSLLLEIRREREELRRERDELRREKEELRMERALMQMENEKMATLLESQRHMTDQRLESIARLDRALEAHAPSAPSPVDVPAQTPQYARQQRTPRPTRLPSPLHVVHRDHSVQQLKNSIASLAVGRAPQQPSPIHNRRQHRQESRLGAMSMADFASPTSQRSPPTRGADRFRFRFNERENPLERSLHGESEFVALSPRPARDNVRQYGAAPRITETRSPVASMMDQRAHPLRSSRVIKSRGFYDINREDALPQQRAHPAPGTLEDHHSPLQTRSERPSVHDVESSDDELPLLGRTYRPGDLDSGLFDSKFQKNHHGFDAGHEKEDEDDYSEEADGVDGASESHNGSELSRSLFQVQVLVKE